MVCVWVAPTSDDIMHPCAVFVETVVDGVLHDRRKRPQIGHVAPQSVSAREMCGVYLEARYVYSPIHRMGRVIRPECDVPASSCCCRTSRLDCSTTSNSCRPPEVRACRESATCDQQGPDQQLVRCAVHQPSHVLWTRFLAFTDEALTFQLLASRAGISRL